MFSLIITAIGGLFCFGTIVLIVLGVFFLLSKIMRP